ncbi:unnamed protein product [Bemisia tabaci]|uniref:Uncharacterized protein n=1 Tax=Bemisia tabaci TaxID=7038 RepID=A0A9P0AFL4_BEMTA|nr:unnamed protein product [Bemisia tabaci]
MEGKGTENEVGKMAVDDLVERVDKLITARSINADIKARLEDRKVIIPIELATKSERQEHYMMERRRFNLLEENDSSLPKFSAPNTARSINADIKARLEDRKVIIPIELATKSERQEHYMMERRRFNLLEENDSSLPKFSAPNTARSINADIKARLEDRKVIIPIELATKSERQEHYMMERRRFNLLEENDSSLPKFSAPNTARSINADIKARLEDRKVIIPIELATKSERQEHYMMERRRFNLLEENDSSLPKFSAPNTARSINADIKARLEDRKVIIPIELATKSERQEHYMMERRRFNLLEENDSSLPKFSAPNTARSINADIKARLEDRKVIIPIELATKSERQEHYMMERRRFNLLEENDSSLPKFSAPNTARSINADIKARLEDRKVIIPIELATKSERQEHYMMERRRFNLLEENDSSLPKFSAPNTARSINADIKARLEDRKVIIPIELATKSERQEHYMMERRRFNLLEENDSSLPKFSAPNLSPGTAYGRLVSLCRYVSLRKSRRQRLPTGKLNLINPARFIVKKGRRTSIRRDRAHRDMSRSLPMVLFVSRLTSRCPRFRSTEKNARFSRNWAGVGGVLTVLRRLWPFMTAVLWCSPCVIKPYEDGVAAYYLRDGPRYQFGWHLEEMCHGLLNRFVREVQYGRAGGDPNRDGRVGRELLRFIVEWETGDQEELFVWLLEVPHLPPPTQW